MINLDDLTYKIRLDDSEVERSAAATAAQMQKLGGAVAPAQRQFNELGKSTKLTRQEMLALNYTVSDVAASLASGASPFTILLQQGGQMRDAFGGIGPLFSKLGAAITIGRLAVGGMAAAVGVLAYAFVQGSLESDAFQKAINRTGNAAGLTEARFRAMTQEIAAASGATIGFSHDVLSALVATGQFGPQAIGAVGAAATAMAKAYGKSADDVVKDFAGMSQGVAKWAAEHNRSMNFITVDQYKYIRSLEAQGRVAEAQIETARLVREASERVTKNLGWLEQAWDAVKKKASEAWDAMLSSGREATLEDQLAEAQKKLNEYQQRPMQNPFRLRDLKNDLKTLQEAVEIERAQAAKKGADAEKNRKEIEQQQKAAVDASLSVEKAQFNRSQAAAELARQKEKIAVERQFDELELSYTAYIAARERLDREALDAKAAAIDEEIALEKKRVVEKPEDTLQQVARLTELEARRLGVLRERAELEERIRRGEAGYHVPKSLPETPQQQFNRFERQQQADLEKSEKDRRAAALGHATELRSINQDLTVSLIKDDRARGLAQIAIEKATLRSRLDLDSLSAEDRKRVENDLAEWQRLREAQLTEELKPEYQRRLELYQDFNRYMQQASDEFRLDFVASGKEAFLEWERTGKLSANTITSYIRRKFAELVYDQFLAGIFDQLGKSIFSFFTGFGGGSSLAVDTASIGITSGLGLADFGLGGGRAAGGSVRRGSIQRVNEFGAELLTVKGRDYLMMGADFGKVTPVGPAAQSSGSRQPSFDNSVTIGSVGAGMSRGEVQAIVRNALAQQEVRFRRLAADGRL